MIERNSEQFIVAQKIKERFEPFYEVLLNVDSEVHFIGTVFPDMILVDKTTKTPLFIIDIRKNGNIGSCLQQWKIRGRIPVTLYMVVPQQDLESAKSIAAVAGVNTRFGFYSLDSSGQVNELTFQ